MPGLQKEAELMAGSRKIPDPPAWATKNNANMQAWLDKVGPPVEYVGSRKASGTLPPLTDDISDWPVYLQCYVKEYRVWESVQANKPPPDLPKIEKRISSNLETVFFLIGFLLVIVVICIGSVMAMKWFWWWWTIGQMKSSAP